MPSLTHVRDAAVKTLRAACPEIKSVKAFSGELDLDTAKTKALPSGVSVLVAVLEAENATAGLCLDLTGTFAALVVVNDTRDRERLEAHALAVAEVVTATLHGNSFGLAGVSPALVRSLSPLADDELDKAGLAVWSIIWQQGFVFTLTEVTP